MLLLYSPRYPVIIQYTCLIRHQLSLLIPCLSLFLMHRKFFMRYEWIVFPCDFTMESGGNELFLQPPFGIKKFMLLGFSVKNELISMKFLCSKGPLVLLCKPNVTTGTKSLGIRILHFPMFLLRSKGGLFLIQHRHLQG